MTKGMIQFCEKSEALRPAKGGPSCGPMTGMGGGMQYTDHSGYTYRAAISGKNEIRRFDAL